jgi:NADPH-dependent 2,4-dienoyl-CoA reductase/sulfur reductase-like enzyme
MKPKRYDVAIVGSGLSGIVAANTLADHNLNVVLLDENIHIGGQILRTIPERLGTHTVSESDKVRKTGFRFIDNIKQKKITVMNQTVVMAIYPERGLLVEENGKSVFTIRPEIILFATGARERFLPFKGWTLPGVISTGAVQVLMKSSGILFSKKILIGGSGLFLYSVAHDFAKNGGTVVAVLEQTSMVDKLAFLTQVPHQFSKLAEGARYVSKLLFSGVPIRHSTKIIEARGDRYVREVLTAKVDQKGAVRRGSERIYQTSALAIGYGFTPNIELPQLAGCELEYEEGKGGWVVKVTDALETSVQNIYAAGEITGIGGALKSLNEGVLAALSILKKLGKIEEREFLPQFQNLTRQRRHHLRFGNHFNALYRIPDEAISVIPDETVICRCEDVTMGNIRKALLDGFRTPAAIKRATRIGMGRCQGRICGSVLYDIVAAYTKKPVSKIPLLSVRPPVKPISLGSLVAGHGECEANTLPCPTHH